MAIFGDRNQDQRIAEIERLTAENGRLCREVERLEKRLKTIEQEAANSDLRAARARQKLEEERLAFAAKQKRLEQAYNRIKKQRDKLRIGNKGDAL